MYSKKAAREFGRQQRLRLGAQQVALASVEANMRLQTALNWEQFSKILLYRSMISKQEISLDGFARYARQSLPGTEVVWQPQNNTVLTETFDVVVVPCLAVDEIGNRVGYGGGFYDKFATLQPGALWVVVAYDDAIVKRIAREPHDKKADLVVSDKRTLYLGDLVA